MTSLKAPQIVTNINNITTKSLTLQNVAKSINVMNGPLFIIGQGPLPQIIMGLGDIVSNVTLNAGQLQGTQPFTAKSDEDSISDAWKNYVATQTDLLNILIGKAGLVCNASNVSFIGAPIAQSLKMLEGAIDVYGNNLIDICPDDAADIKNQQKSFDITMSKAITAYSETA